jgi:hypothetical protein
MISAKPSGIVCLYSGYEMKHNITVYNTFSYDELIRVIAKAIFITFEEPNYSNYEKKYPEGCGCQGQKERGSCLQETDFKFIDSRYASRCFVDYVGEVFQDKYSCLIKPTNASLTKLPLMGNGIVEIGESCDCFYRNKACWETCPAFPLQLGFPREIRNHDLYPKSKMIMALAAVLILVLFVFCCIFFRRRKLRTTLRDSSRHTIKTENELSDSTLPLYRTNEMKSVDNKSIDSAIKKHGSNQSVTIKIIDE